ncbi:hypothetical protein CARUB_v10024084mg, partial [Capsella rubella]
GVWNFFFSRNIHHHPPNRKTLIFESHKAQTLGFLLIPTAELRSQNIFYNPGSHSLLSMEKGLEDKEEFDEAEIEYTSYAGEHHLPLIMSLVDQELSEPYSIFTYRYFVYLWPQLCFLAFHKGKCIGTVVCKMGDHRQTFRGYIAMLVVIKPYRGRGIASELVTRSIKAMMESGCEEIRHYQASSFMRLRYMSSNITSFLSY